MSGITLQQLPPELLCCIASSLNNIEVFLLKCTSRYLSTSINLSVRDTTLRLIYVYGKTTDYWSELVNSECSRPEAYSYLLNKASPKQRKSLLRQDEDYVIRLTSYLGYSKVLEVLLRYLGNRFVNSGLIDLKDDSGIRLMVRHISDSYILNRTFC